MSLHPQFPTSPYDFLYVDQVGFEKHLLETFAALAVSFTEYKSS